MLYHITLKANFNSIMEKGLLPKTGINTSPEDMGCDWSYDAYYKYIDRFGDYISYNEYKKQKKSDWDIIKKNKITKGVYFGLHINVCLQMASAMKKLRHEELVLLAVDSSKLKTELLIDDPDANDSKCYKNKIPPHLINVIATGTNKELTDKLI